MICRINYAIPIKPELVRFELVCFESLEDGDCEHYEYEITLNVSDITSKEELQTKLTEKVNEIMYLNEQCEAWAGLEWRL